MGSVGDRIHIPRKRLLLLLAFTLRPSLRSTCLAFSAPRFHSLLPRRIHYQSEHSSGVLQGIAGRTHLLLPIYASSAVDNDAANEDKNDAVVDLEYIKQELTEYMAKRKEAESQTDTAAATNEPRVIGGSKGNKVLEFVSVIPAKEQIVSDTPNLLDYDELIKYGYSHLVTPIMKAGGRYRMYELMGLETPAAPPPPTQTFVGSGDIIMTNSTSNYAGLQLGLLYDDAAQAEALFRASQQQKQTADTATTTTTAAADATIPDEIRTYRQPFADKRNVGPAQTPDWTPERLDAYARQQGKAQAWARAAREGKFVKDPYESWDSVNGWQQAYSIVTALMTAIGFGRATAAVITMAQEEDSAAAGAALSLLLPVIQVVAVGLLMASAGSTILSVQKASEQQRSATLWAIKGWLGGPLTVRQLQDLPTLRTQREVDADQ